MKLKIIILLSLLFLYINSSSQNNSELDSLKSVLKICKTDTQKIVLYNKLSVLYSKDNFAYATKYCDSALLLSNKINSNYFKAVSLSIYGDLLVRKAESKNALNAYYKSNSLLNTNQLLQKGDNFLGIAIAYKNIGKTDSFFFNIFNAANIFSKINRNDKLAVTYANIAYGYLNTNSYDNVKKYANLSIDICAKINDKSCLSKNYQNLGVMYETINMNDSALLYYKKGLELKKELNDSIGLITSYIGLALINRNLNNHTEFFQNIYFALNLALRKKSPRHIAECYSELGVGYYVNEKFPIDSAIKYFQLSLKIQKSIQDKGSISDSHMYLAECYSIKGDYKNAFENQKLCKIYRDSVFNETSNKQVEELRTEYETEKKEKENKLLQTENKLSTATIKQQKTITYFIIAGLLIVSCLAFFIFNGLKKQRHANKIISKQKEEVHLQKAIIEEHQKETIDSINYAKRIQYALLANSDLLVQNIPEHFVLFNPKDIVSGDFYWATEHNNKFYLAVCDSTGHGVPGAFMSLLNMGFLSEAIKEKHIEKPNEVLNYVRKRLIDSIGNEGQQDGMDAILICIDKSVQTELRIITYAAANNEPVLIRENQILILPKDKMPVGKGEKLDSFTLQEISCHKGDTLYLYTDGYADQFGGPKGKKFKYKPLNELLLSISNDGMIIQKNILETHFVDWKGNLEQVDDVCVIGIKI